LNQHHLPRLKESEELLASTSSSLSFVPVVAAGVLQSRKRLQGLEGNTKNNLIISGKKNNDFLV
jgi:hypothetical protein